jgi:hypothetical protein
VQAALKWADDVSVAGRAAIEKIHPRFGKPLAAFSAERLASSKPPKRLLIRNEPVANRSEIMIELVLGTKRSNLENVFID